MQLKEIERVQDAPHSLAHADIMILTDVLFFIKGYCGYSNDSTSWIDLIRCINFLLSYWVTQKIITKKTSWKVTIISDCSSRLNSKRYQTAVYF